MGTLIPFDFASHNKQKERERETYRVLKAAMACPPCKTVTDFFAYYGCSYNTVLSVAGLPWELKIALAERILRLTQLVDGGNKLFCARYGVSTVTALSVPQFREYQQSLKKFVDREDYYTNIPSCKLVTDFFRQYKVPYYTPASLDRLSPILRIKLRSALDKFSRVLGAARESLLLQHGAINELALSTEAYAQYTKALREVIAREDHYP